MSRFSALKENPFTSKKREKRNGKEIENNKEENKFLQSSSRVNNRQNNRQNTIKKTEENFPALVKEEKVEEIYKPIDTKWADLMKTEENKEKENEIIIDDKDPKYWNGYKWKGPILMKSTPLSASWKSYIKNATKAKASTIIIPKGETLYSRNGRDWAKSFDETFTEAHLEKIREQENEELMIRWCNKFEELYERRREESARNAEETGEIDYIALAEKEREEYEEYAKQFEEESEEEIVVEEDEEEYDSDY